MKKKFLPASGQKSCLNFLQDWKDKNEKGYILLRATGYILKNFLQDFKHEKFPATGRSHGRVGFHALVVGHIPVKIFLLVNYFCDATHTSNIMSFIGQANFR